MAVDLLNWQEPVTLDEVRQHMRRDADETWDDDLIATYIVANREFLEQYLGLSLVPKTNLKYKYRRGCNCGYPPKVYLPYGPVNEITVVDGDLKPVAYENLSPDDYYPAFKFDKSVTITYSAGDWEGNMPFAIKTALMMLTSTSYLNRESYVVGVSSDEVTKNALELAHKFSRNLYL